jgi:alpha-tubulin suppressor-like RCC1 family protein
LSYQWLRNTFPIQGATAARFSFSATLADDGARFSVTISNAGGTITSNQALLQVEPAGVAPAIGVNPSAVSAQVGQQAVFGVQATGTAPLAYQWRRNGVSIPGAVQESLVINGLTLADNGAKFSVDVSNPFGSVSSTEAVLSVSLAVIPSLIGTLQGPGEVSRRASATFSVVANGTPPFQFQWRRDGVDIPGATSESYTRTNVTLDDHLTAYTVVVSNAIGIATSKPLLLRVAEPPVLGTGRFFSLAASAAAGLCTWGDNERKTLGRNPELDRAVRPGLVTLPGDAAVRQVAGGVRHALALRSDGSVWAWGSNGNGQLGNGLHSPPGPVDFVVPAPVQLPTGTLIRKIAAAGDFSLALDSNGKVWGWGDNSGGQTGNGKPGGDFGGLISGIFLPVPAAIPSTIQIVDIAAADEYGLALTSDGVIWGWGLNRAGGFASVPFNTTPMPLDLGILADVRPVALRAAYGHALFFAEDGSAWEWGSFGPPLTFPINIAAKVNLALASGVTVVGFAGGLDHSLYLTSDGAVYAAGREEFGALGNGQARLNFFQTVPVRTLRIGPPAQRAIAVAAGERHSLAILSDGSVVGWGANSPGQLGDGTETTRLEPVSSSGLDLEPPPVMTGCLP